MAVSQTSPALNHDRPFLNWLARNSKYGLGFSDDTVIIPIEALRVDEGVFYEEAANMAGG